MSISASLQIGAAECHLYFNPFGAEFSLNFVGEKKQFYVIKIKVNIQITKVKV